MIQITVGASKFWVNENLSTFNASWESKINTAKEELNQATASIDSKISSAQGRIMQSVNQQISEQTQEFARSQDLQNLERRVDDIKVGEEVMESLTNVQNALLNLDTRVQGNQGVLDQLNREYDRLKDLNAQSIQTSVMANIDNVLQDIRTSVQRAENQAVQANNAAIAAQGAASTAQGRADAAIGMDIAGVIQDAINEGRVSVQGMTAEQVGEAISNALAGYVQGYQINGFASQGALDNLVDTVSKINPGMTREEIVNALSNAEDAITVGMTGLIPIWASSTQGHGVFVTETLNAMWGPQGVQSAITTKVETANSQLAASLSAQMAAISTGVQESALNEMIQGAVNGQIPKNIVTQSMLAAQGFVTQGTMDQALTAIPVGHVQGLDNYLTNTAEVAKRTWVNDQLSQGVTRAKDSIIQEVGDIVDKSVREMSADVLDIDGIVIPTSETDKSDNESFNKLVEKMENTPMRKADVMNKILDEDMFYWYVLPPIDQRIYRDTIVGGTVIEPGWMKAVKERYWYHKQDADIRDHYIYLFRGDHNKFQIKEYSEDQDSRFTDISTQPVATFTPSNSGISLPIFAGREREPIIAQLHSNELRKSKGGVPSDIALIGIPTQNNQTGFKRRNEIAQDAGTDQMHALDSKMTFPMASKSTKVVTSVDNPVPEQSQPFANVGLFADSTLHVGLHPTKPSNKPSLTVLPKYGWFVNPVDPTPTPVVPAWDSEAETDAAYAAGNFPSEYEYIACYAECDDSSMYENREFYDNTDGAITSIPKGETGTMDAREMLYIPIYRDDNAIPRIGHRTRGEQADASKIVKAFIQVRSVDAFEFGDIITDDDDTTKYALLKNRSTFTANMVRKLERRAFADVCRDIKVYMLPITVWGSLAIGHDLEGVTDGSEGNRITIDSMLTPAIGTRITRFTTSSNKITLNNGNSNPAYGYVCRDNVKVAESGYPCVYGQGYCWLPINAVGSVDDYTGVCIHNTYTQDYMWNANGVYAHYNGRIPSGYTKATLKNLVTIYKKRIVEKFVLGKWINDGGNMIWSTNEWTRDWVGDVDIDRGEIANGNINIFVPDYSDDQLADLNENIFKVTFANDRITYQIKDGYMVANSVDGGVTISPAIIQTINYLTENGKSNTNQVFLFCVEDDGDEYIFDEYVWMDGQVHKLNEQTRIKYSDELRQIEYVHNNIGVAGENVPRGDGLSNIQAGKTYSCDGNTDITFENLDKDLLSETDIKNYLFSTELVETHHVNNPDYIPAVNAYKQVLIKVDGEDALCKVNNDGTLLFHEASDWNDAGNKDVIYIASIGEMMTHLLIQAYKSSFVEGRKQILQEMFKTYADAGKAISLGSSSFRTCDCKILEKFGVDKDWSMIFIPFSAIPGDKGTTLLDKIDNKTETDLSQYDYFTVYTVVDGPDGTVVGNVFDGNIAGWDFTANNVYIGVAKYNSAKNVVEGVENFQIKEIDGVNECFSESISGGGSSTISKIDSIFEPEYRDAVIDLVWQYLSAIHGDTNDPARSWPDEWNEDTENKVKTYLANLIGPEYQSKMNEILANMDFSDSYVTDDTSRPDSPVQVISGDPVAPAAEDPKGGSKGMTKLVYWTLLCDPRMWVVLHNMGNDAYDSSKDTSCYYWFMTAIDNLKNVASVVNCKVSAIYDTETNEPISLDYTVNLQASNVNAQAAVGDETIDIKHYELVPNPLTNIAQNQSTDEIKKHMRGYRYVMAFLKRINSGPSMLKQGVLGGGNSQTVQTMFDYVYELWRWSPAGTYINLGQRVVSKYLTYTVGNENNKLNELRNCPHIQVSRAESDTSTQAQVVNVIQPHIEHVEDELAWLNSPDFEAILLSKCPTLKRLLESPDLAVDEVAEDPTQPTVLKKRFRIREPQALIDFRSEANQTLLQLNSGVTKLHNKMNVVASAVNAGGTVVVDANNDSNWSVGGGQSGAAPINTQEPQVQMPNPMSQNQGFEPPELPVQSQMSYAASGSAHAWQNMSMGGGGAYYTMR